MTQEQLYQSIAERTGGDIYIGVVGPVRCGKSTFIKKFAELLFLPNIEDEAKRARALDELPQSAAGRTIMTTEPKFIPEKAVEIKLPDGGCFRARLVDCVGYMVEGALGDAENSAPRLVKSPWFEKEVPFALAAETGTRRVIREHATVGVVVTTDGSVANLPRENYLNAERQVVKELEEIGKPFVILLNCTNPTSEAAQKLAQEMQQEYGHKVLPVNCTMLDEAFLTEMMQDLLYEFPVKEIGVYLPKWLPCLKNGHWLQSAVYRAILEYAEKIHKMSDAAGHSAEINCEYLTDMKPRGMDLSTGRIRLKVQLKEKLFYQILGEEAGLEIEDEADLLPHMVELAAAKRAYDKMKGALEQVEATGYGIVMPDSSELTLEEPEIVRQGGQYGVRLSASAPSLHIMKANIHTELSPTVGSEAQGEALISSLLQDFENDPKRLWSTNIFGKSLNELVGEGLQAKLNHMPQEARNRLQTTLERIINEGCEGLICILL